MLKNLLVFSCCIQVSLLFSQGMPPVASFTASSYSACAGGIITFSDLSTNSPTAWVWAAGGGTTSNGYSSTPTFTFSNAGSYTVTLVSSNQYGISNKAVQLVQVRANPTVSAASDKSIVARGCENATLTAFGAGTFTWSTGGSGSVIVVSPLNYGFTTYTVTGTGQYGCVNSATVGFTVWLCVDVPENDDGSGLVYLYPNPCTEFIVLQKNGGLGFRFEIFGVAGELRVSGEADQQSLVSCDGWPPGMYLVKLSIGSGHSVFKLLKN